MNNLANGVEKMTSIAKIAKVEAKPDHTLAITFRNGKEKFVKRARLTGFIARYKGLSALMNAETFKKAKVKDWGAAVGWPGDLDIGASTLLRVAEEQAPFGANEFKAWQKRTGMSNQEAADALGVTLSTIKNLRAGTSPISSSVAIACRAMEAEPVVFAAHFQPRVTGRPKAA